MNNLIPESSSEGDRVSFRHYHTNRLQSILKHHAVSQLLNKTFPAEYLYLTRNLCNEERQGLSAAYKTILHTLPEVLQAPIYLYVSGTGLPRGPRRRGQGTAPV